MCLAPSCKHHIYSFLNEHKLDPSQNSFKVRLVSLCGTAYEKEFFAFNKRMNSILSSSWLVIDTAKSIYLTLGKLLFNNNDSEHAVMRNALYV